MSLNSPDEAVGAGFGMLSRIPDDGAMLAAVQRLARGRQEAQCRMAHVRRRVASLEGSCRSEAAVLDPARGPVLADQPRELPPATVPSPCLGTA